jgi:cation:H+ antiporter
MPLAGKLEKLLLFYVLPTLLAFLLFTSVRAWRRQHHKRDVP